MENTDDSQMERRPSDHLMIEGVRELNRQEDKHDLEISSALPDENFFSYAN